MWVKENAWALFFALLIGVLSVAPHLLAWHALGASYQGIPFLESSNEDYYLARIHEIADGHFMVGSPYFYEYKSILPLIPPVGEYFYIIVGFLFHVALPNALVIAKFLFPAILFLLVYKLVRLISEDEDASVKNIWGAIAAGLFVTLGYDLIDYHTTLNRLTHGGDNLMLSLWVRPVNPITGALILFTFLILLWKTTKKSSWCFPIFSGVVLALSIGYIFSFALGLTVLVILTLFAAIHKDWDQAKRLAAAGTIGVILDALYWWSALPAVSGGRELAERNGMLYMHTPILNKVLIAACFIFFGLLIYAYRYRGVHVIKEYKTHASLWFASSFLLGGLTVFNQQIFTGRAIWPFHFVQYTIPLAIIAVFVCLFRIVRPRSPRTWGGIMIVTIAVCVSLGVANAATYTFEMKNFQDLQHYATTFAWLDSNTPKDCVVLVAEGKLERLTGLIPAFTHCNVYLTNYMANTIPKERIMHDFYIKLFLQGVTADTVADYLAKDSEIVQMYFYKDWIELLSYKKEPRIQALIPGLVVGYQDFAKRDIATELEKYHIDYLVSDSELNSNVKASLPLLHEVYTTGSITIYSLK